MTGCAVLRKARSDIEVVDGIAVTARKLGTASVADACLRGPTWWQPLHHEVASRRP